MPANLDWGAMSENIILGQLLRVVDTIGETIHKNHKQLSVKDCYRISLRLCTVKFVFRLDCATVTHPFLSTRGINNCLSLTSTQGI